jgi:hypothetical protein
MQLVDGQEPEVDQASPTGLHPAPTRHPLAQPYRLGFIAHTSQRVLLRPVGPVPATLPRELRPGERLGSLDFAELARAFKGVVQLDFGTGAAGIIEEGEGAPRRVSFRVDGSGVVALRALGGHGWSEDVPPGRPVFGIAPELLRSAREGVLALDPATLTASLEAQVGWGSVRDEGDGSRSRRPRALLVGAVVILAAAAALGGWWGLDRMQEEPPSALPPPQRQQLSSSPEDSMARLESLAASVSDPSLRADLAGIGKLMQRERLVREREHGQAAVSAIKAGAQLARGYRRDVADVRRLETALAVCGGDQACRQQYEPALARATAARELTRDAYVDLLRQVAETYPQALLENRLMAVEAQHGDLDEVGGVPDLARRFVAQVARWRGGSAGDREAIARELLGD